MKRLIALFVAALISVSLIQAGEVKMNSKRDKNPGVLFAKNAGDTGKEESDADSEEKLEVPDESELKEMTEAALVSFGNGVKKQDFSAFYKEIATVWQKQTSPEKLRDTFKDFYGKNIDLQAAIEDEDPVFNHPAAIGPNDVLMIQGYYPTKPNRIVFELKYLEEDSEWKLVGINVNLKE